MTEQQLKKGLFRLWIVFSVIHTCWVSLEFVDARVDSEEIFFQAERWERMGVSERQEIAARYRFDYLLVELEKNLVYLRNGRPQGHGAGYTTKELASHIMYHHQNYMIFLVIYGIANPIVVLLLGKTIFWIVKGFKKSD